MVDWEDFKKQSKSDIAACKLLYDTGDYGNAAYHLQQAVEKHAKAILLHGNLMPKLKTHLPLSEFIGEFVRDLHYFSAIAIKYNIRVFELDASDSRTNQLLNETIIMMSALREGKKSFIDALWKNSLGIPLVDKQEEAVFQRCPKFSKYYKRKIIRVYGYDNVTARDKFMNDAVIKKLG